MKRSGVADLPLHGGHVPPWLAQRMERLGIAILEAIVHHYGTSEFLTRISDPFWFQSFGAVMGMDWHSSGITTSVLGALKRGMRGRERELGLFICGGRGRQSRKTPDELLRVSDQCGLNGDDLVRTSRLTARIDNNAVADGFQIYLHSFLVTAEGEWAVVQQGLNKRSGLARRYHWHSPVLRDFVQEPHAAIVGQPAGPIMNLVDKEASPIQSAMLQVLTEHPAKTLQAARRLHLPRHHQVRAADVDLKRLGAVLLLAYEKPVRDFASLLLLQSLGPRTLQTMALVAEVIHGTPSRFADPARFSFANGGKDGHPFPVPLKTYDETLNVLRRALHSAKLGHGEKMDGIRRLDGLTRKVEREYQPIPSFSAVLETERAISPALNGRVVTSGERVGKSVSKQLSLFVK